MKIKLWIDGKERTFIAPFISTRMLKTTLELSDKIQNGFGEKMMDEIVNYMVKLYGKQFTIDQLYDGFPGNKFVNKVFEDIQKMLSGFDNEVKN